MTLNSRRSNRRYKKGDSIVVDDENRENEGDFVAAAEKVTQIL